MTGSISGLEGKKLLIRYYHISCHVRTPARSVNENFSKLMKYKRIKLKPGSYI